MQTGGSEALDHEEAKVLDKLKDDPRRKMLESRLKRDHANIATQLRNFRRDKLTHQMPNLAAHLKATLKLDFPKFGYFPPDPVPPLQF